jgi:hypothetical protein
MGGMTSIAMFRPFIAGLAEMAAFCAAVNLGCLSGLYVVLEWFDFWVDFDFVDCVVGGNTKLVSNAF